VGGEPNSEVSYTLDPTKDPKQIDLVTTVPQPQIAGQKPLPPQQIMARGLYTFEQGRLKLYI
jgi:hypothetical protein